MTEDEMAGWHHQLSEHEFEQTPGDSEETQAGGLPFRSRWRRAFLSSYEPRFPDTGKSGS